MLIILLCPLYLKPVLLDIKLLVHTLSLVLVFLIFLWHKALLSKSLMKNCVNCLMSEAFSFSARPIIEYLNVVTQCIPSTCKLKYFISGKFLFLESLLNQGFSNRLVVFFFSTQGSCCP